MKMQHNSVYVCVTVDEEEGLVGKEGEQMSEREREKEGRGGV